MSNKTTQITIIMGDGGISGVSGLPDNTLLQFRDYNADPDAEDNNRTVVVDPDGDRYEVIDIARDF